MLRNFIKRQVAHFLIIILFASFFLHVDSSYAIYDGERYPNGYNQNSHMCGTGEFKYDPGSSNNKDINWELDNPVCLSFMAIQGLLIMGTSALVNSLCVPTNTYGTAASIKEMAEEAILPDTPFITPITFYKMTSRMARCAARSYENGLATGTLATCISTASAAAAGSLGAGSGAYAACVEPARQVGLATADQNRCCISYASYAAAVGQGLAILATIYASAKGAYDKARVCGHDWNTWRQVDKNGDYDSPLEKIRWRSSKYPGSYQYCIEDIFAGHEDQNGNVVYNSCGFGAPSVSIFESSAAPVSADAVDIRNKYYREYLYGGKEYIDNGTGSCENPSSWDSARRIKSLGYDGKRQRYYMRGPGVASNYACQRFALSAASDASANAAYECCKRRSQNSICIENTTLIGGDYENQFCEIGSRCIVKGITFETYSSKVASNFACAKTYSVCPYNHLLGGGTEKAVYKKNPDGSPTSDLENFCQYRNHCVKLPVVPYIRISNLDGAYIAAACRDLKGDSQNVYGYNAELLPISSRGFSAPIVQCFKETLENALLNRAGDTKCRNPDELPSRGICTSGYFYKKDQSLADDVSFFVKIQNMLRAAIQMALTISVTLLGAMVLLGGSPLNKKQLLSYIVKLGLVMYFALGTGWQFGFINGVLNTSNYLSDIMMKIDSDSTDPQKLDGCQFPRFNYADSNESTKYSNKAYPPGREYLKIWDVLDCKLARALGFGPELSVPNLVKMIFAGLITSGYGLIFFIATFIYALFMLSLVMRAIHIFLMASVSIVLLIYISPVIITLAMFERTKAIFEKWWKQILGLSLQPVILFAYLGVYIALFDNLMIGGATFKGDGISAPKTVSCNSESNNKSLYCIFRIADIKTYSGLEIIGIGLPVLASVNGEKLNSIIKAAFIMFIFAGFMDKISGIAAELVGGSELKSGSASAMELAQKTLSGVSAVQKRGTRVAAKAIRQIPKAVGWAKDQAYGILNQGHQVADMAKGKGADDSASSGKKADDAGKSSDKADAAGSGAKGSDAASSSSAAAAAKPAEKNDLNKDGGF